MSVSAGLLQLQINKETSNQISANMYMELGFFFILFFSKDGKMNRFLINLRIFGFFSI